MRNLNRITNYFNRLEAWRDWNKTMVLAEAYGVEYKDIQPSPNDSWKKIDNATSGLRTRIHLLNLISDDVVGLEVHHE